MIGVCLAGVIVALVVVGIFTAAAFVVAGRLSDQERDND